MNPAPYFLVNPCPLPLGEPAPLLLGEPAPLLLGEPGPLPLGARVLLGGLLRGHRAGERHGLAKTNPDGHQMGYIWIFFSFQYILAR